VVWHSSNGNLLVLINEVNRRRPS